MPVSSLSTANLSIAQTSTISVGGTVAARIARHPVAGHASSSTAPAPSTQDDGFNEYRNLCELRIRRLERYKKAKSFCSLDSEDSLNYGNVHNAAPATSHSTTSSSCSSSRNFTDDSLSSSESTEQLAPQATTRSVSATGQTLFDTQMEQLKQNMISLMENDVQLLQKLVALGETIQELKTPRQSTSTASTYRPRCLPRTSSETSLSSSYGEEEDDWRPLESRESFSQSMSAITRLYVGSGNADGGAEPDDEDEPKPDVQYFSRKNSVLRIPIPPRASNRMNGNRMLRRPSQLLRQCPPRLLPSEDSGHSSSDATPPQQHSPCALSSDGTSTISSVSSAASYGTSASRQPSYGLYDIQERSPMLAAKNSRRSNGSVDSGIGTPPAFVSNVKTA